MANLVKNHETNLTTEKNQNDVNSILEGVENVPFALSGATTKTILYALFSVLAAMELTSALGFYVASFNVSLMVSFVFCSMVAAMFHTLLHSILSNTAHGIVFRKRAESRAMSAEVIANIVLSVVLLLGASCTVFFVGKKGFTAYRATEFETKMQAVTSTTPPAPTITPDMLTSKRGKISVYKLELLGKLENAKAASTNATTSANTTEKDSYDKNTATITDIVGTSAFALELLLALLAFTIATAKKAATIEEIARRKQNSVTLENTTVNDSNAQKTVNYRENPTVTVERNAPPTVSPPISTVTVTPANNGKNDALPLQPLCDNSATTATVSPQRTVVNGFGASALTDNKHVGTCPNCRQDFERKNVRKIYCSITCKTQHWQNKNGVSLLGEPLNK